MDDRIPVIIHPSSLCFYSDDTSTHQQPLTLYNPYDISLKYKVLCTAREKYRVIESEGILKPRCSVDIIFKHKDICHDNERIQDKFRIQISEFGKKKTIGKKDFSSILLPTNEKPLPKEDDFEAMSFPSLQQPAAPAADHLDQTPISSSPSLTQVYSPVGSWCLVLVGLCTLFLMACPLESEDSLLPQWIRVTRHQKYISAYILGLLTMKLLQSV